MVGSVANASDGSLDGFIRSPGGGSQFWSTPGFLVFPTSINGAGTIVGVNIPVPAALPRGFMRFPEGVETPYNFPGALGTIPFGINDAGVVSGFYITSEGRKGFVRDGSGALSRSVEFAGASETQLYALNEVGLVGGASYDADGVASPLLYDLITETFTPVPKPIAGDNFVVSSVNASGDAIVFGLASAAEAYVDVSSYVYDASEGTLTQLGVPGALETYGYDLRDDGTVLGYFQDPGSTYGGFRAVVPEPASVALAGVAAMGLLRRRSTG